MDEYNQYVVSLVKKLAEVMDNPFYFGKPRNQCRSLYVKFYWDTMGQLEKARIDFLSGKDFSMG